MNSTENRYRGQEQQRKQVQGTRTSQRTGAQGNEQHIEQLQGAGTPQGTGTDGRKITENRYRGKEHYREQAQGEEHTVTEYVRGKLTVQRTGTGGRNINKYRGTGT